MHLRPSGQQDLRGLRRPAEPHKALLLRGARHGDLRGLRQPRAAHQEVVHGGDGHRDDQQGGS